MTFRQKFFLKLALCLLGALLVSEFLTKFVFYPTSPATQLSFRIWLAQKKQQIAALPKTFRKKPPIPAPQLPSPIFYKPQPPSPTTSPYPRQPTPPPKLTPTPVPTSPKPPSSTPSPSLTPTPSISPSLTPHPSPSTPKPQPPDIKKEVMEVVRLINEERAKRNLKSLDTPDLLMKAAQVYIEDLGPYLYQNKKCGHGVPDKGLIWDYAKRLGYGGRPVGEVAICGARTPRETVNGWMGSPPHRDCIMNKSGRSIGVGVWYVPGDSWGRAYWVGGVYY